MKVIVALAAVLAVALAAPADTYDSRYDNFNAQEIAENTRLLKAYGHCFLAMGPCTAEGTDFKKVMPEAVKTKCAKCTDKQKELIRIIVKAFQEKQPDIWEKLVDQEDPKREYKQAFDEFINGN